MIDNNENKKNDVYGIELLKHAAISIEKTKNNDEIIIDDDRILNGLFWLKNAALFMIKYSNGYSNNSSNDQQQQQQLQKLLTKTDNDNNNNKIFIASEIEIDNVVVTNGGNKNNNNINDDYDDYEIDNINNNNSDNIIDNSDDNLIILHNCSSNYNNNNKLIKSIYNDHTYTKYLSSSSSLRKCNNCITDKGFRKKSTEKYQTIMKNTKWKQQKQNNKLFL